MAIKTALCIGINDYPGTNSDLAGCINDANDWGTVLSGRGFSVSYLLDGAATGQGMRSAISNLIGNANPGDTLALQYSGHGSFIPDLDGDEPDGTDECLCPHDIATEGPLTDDELSTLFAARAPGVKLVFISDSCNSGTVSRFAPISTPGTTASGFSPQRLVRFLPPMAFLSESDGRGLGIRSRRPASPPGRHHALLLSGCQDTEYSYDAWFQGRANGAFTYVALQELAKLAPEATYQDWHNAIRQVLPSGQYPQSPNLYGTRAMKKWTAF